MNKQGAIVGMITGLLFTLGYIIYFKFGMALFGLSAEAVAPDRWWFQISPEGIGTLGMLLNFVVSYVVMKLTPAPPQHVQELVESIRYPRGAGEATHH